jgi:hypothetical protein
MQIATIISLAGTLTAAGVFGAQKRWVPSAVFILLTIYTVLDKIIHIRQVPAIAIEALPYLALALAIYEILRKVVK